LRAWLFRYLDVRGVAF